LSKKTIKDLLIDKIGFEGVIISDDYDMKAIRDNYSLRDIIVNSINSGVNILLFSNNIETKDGNLPLKIRKIIKKEIELGNIKIEDIDNSYQKITRLKRRLSI
jgi:beta-N-acetylhexosaminidase